MKTFLKLDLSKITRKPLNLKQKCIIITLIYSLVIGIWCALQPIFSPIDEGAHVSVIHSIVENTEYPKISDEMDSEFLTRISGRNVPSATMYEAVHPWLPYYIMALPCKLINNPRIMFIVCRLINCIAAIISFYIMLLVIDFLYEKNFINSSDFAINLSLLTFCLPGVLTRFTTVSNEVFAVLFVSCFIYFSIRSIYDGLNFKSFLFLCLFTVFALYSKTTTAYVFVLLLFILIYNKKIKFCIFSIFIIGICLLPWLVSNYSIYGALTGMKQHLDFVLPIVNPKKEKIDIVRSICFLFECFISSQEGLGVYAPAIKQIMIFFEGFLFLGLGICFISTLKTCLGVIKNKSFNYSEEEKKVVIKILCFSALIGNVCILVLGTISSRVNIMLGRYLYLSLVPICLIFISLLQDIKYRKELLLFFMVFVVFINAYDIRNRTLPIFKESISALLGEKISKQNWYGYSKIYSDFKYCIDDEVIGEDYTYIRGWAFHNNDKVRIYIETNGKVYPVKSEMRQDVQNAFGLDSDLQGFSMLIDKKCNNYSLILVNDEQKEIHIEKIK